MDRKDFLKSAALAVGAAATPLSLSAAEKKTVEAKPVVDEGVVLLTRDDGILTEVTNSFDHFNEMSYGPPIRVGPIATDMRMVGFGKDPARRVKAGDWFKYEDDTFEIGGVILDIDREHFESVERAESFTARLRVYCETMPTLKGKP